jgi:hypothetical protein
MVLGILVSSGVALAVAKSGTSGNDTIKGTNRVDALSGKGGNDSVTGLGGGDSISGGSGNDKLFGGNAAQTSRVKGNDSISGGRGNDIVVGGFGADSLSGGSGNDKIIEGPWKDQSVDRLSGSSGDDYLNASNDPGRKDFVSCGPGRDTVEADNRDVVAKDCERVNIFQDSKREAQAKEDSFTAQAIDYRLTIPFECSLPGYFRGSNFCARTAEFVEGETLGIGMNQINTVQTGRFIARGAVGAAYAGSFFADVNLQDRNVGNFTRFRRIYTHPDNARDTEAAIRGEAQSFKNGYAYGYYTID